MNKLISKLVEDYISFNPSVLVDKDKPKHKLPQDITDTLLEEHYKLVDDIKILWNDLSVYTLKEVKERKYGWPLAINLFDNKYLYLLFISTYDGWERGKTTPESIDFGRQGSTEKGIKYSKSLNQDINFPCVELKDDKPYLYYKNVDNEIKSYFNGKYFNGKAQTQKILNNVKFKYDYRAAELVQNLKPGDTEKGDWYIPEIGECAFIYAYKNIINYVCSMLYDLGYKCSYPKLDDKLGFWSSTFYEAGKIWSFSFLHKGFGWDFTYFQRAILPMIEIKNDTNE